MSHDFMPITDKWLLEQMIAVDSLSNRVIFFLWFLQQCCNNRMLLQVLIQNVSSVPKYSGQNEYEI